MKNFIQPGKVVTVTAPYTVLSGGAVLVGALFGIAAYDALIGSPVEIETCGVFALPKTQTEVWVEGAPIYWNAATKLVTTTAAGNTPVGVAIEAATNPSSTGEVKLVDLWPLSSAGMPATATIVAAAGGANVSEVTVSIKDAAGNALATPHNFDIWLSDDADGQGLTGTTASGAVAAKAASGTDLSVLTAKKALRVQSLKTGFYTLSITDTAKTGFYPCVSIGGRTVVGAQLTSAKYG